MPDLLRVKQAFRQLAVPSQISSRLHFRRSHGPAAARDQSLPPPQDSLNHAQPTVNNNNQPLRLRRHGFKSLPLSPLMRADEDAPAPVRRAQPPPSADEALKQFQKEVAMNPFARALSTPIRYCSLTLAHLPSHYLLPFTTLVESPSTTPSASDTTSPPQVKVRLAPGRHSDHLSHQTLPQTSYIINRQDAVRQLSRKRHWTFLVLERQRAKVASLARRSAGSQKLVQDLWVWEGQVDGVGAYLEGRVGVEVRRAVDSWRMGMMGVEDDDASSPEEERVIGLKFSAAAAVGSSEDVTATNTPEETNNTTTYDLTTLLSPSTLDSIKSHAAAQGVTTEGVWKFKGPQHALPIRLTIEKLKSYKESNDIHKALPMVQNPVGSREARLQRLAERGARSWSEEEVKGKES